MGMNIFKAITKKSLRYSVLHSLVITIASFGVALSALQVSSNDVDFRFIGPVAMFLLIVSVVFTLFPFTYLRANAAKQFAKENTVIKSKIDTVKTFFLIEGIVSVFLLLSYIGAMSGSIWGGVGLILLSILNLIGAAVALIATTIGFGVKKFSDESLKYKVDSLGNKNSTIIDYEEVKRYKL